MSGCLREIIVCHLVKFKDNFVTIIRDDLLFYAVFFDVMKKIYT